MDFSSPYQHLHLQMNNSRHEYQSSIKVKLNEYYIEMSLSLFEDRFSLLDFLLGNLMAEGVIQIKLLSFISFLVTDVNIVQSYYLRKHLNHSQSVVLDICYWILT